MKPETLNTKTSMTPMAILAEITSLDLKRKAVGWTPDTATRYAFLKRLLRRTAPAASDMIARNPDALKGAKVEVVKAGECQEGGGE
jgi:hypothetical protein